MKLSDATVKSLKPGLRPQKISDGSGLYLFISPTGAKFFRYAYRFNGKQKLLSLSAIPILVSWPLALPSACARTRARKSRAKKT